MTGGSQHPQEAFRRHRSRPAIMAMVLALLPGTASLCNESEPSPAPLFESREALDVTLEIPVKSFLADRRREQRAYHPAHLTTAGQRLPLQLKMTGDQRAKNCTFPPMKWRFQPQDVAGTLLQGVEQLYFTTLCERGRKFEQYLLGEYLIYASFNQLTDLSYRVRLARVHYLDTQSDDSTTVMAMLAEHQDVMAARHGMRPLLYPEAVARRRIDPQQSGLVCVFQYMIGNTDYSLISSEPGVPCCHNTQLIGATDGPIFTVPYDFDHAGLINASYAVPPAGLRIKSVRQRVYRGLCSLNEYLPAALDRFRTNRPAILDLYRQQPGLTDRNRLQSVKYLERFFTLLDDEGAVRKNILESCH